MAKLIGYTEPWPIYFSNPDKLAALPDTRTDMAQWTRLMILSKNILYRAARSDFSGQICPFIFDLYTSIPEIFVMIVTFRLRAFSKYKKPLEQHRFSMKNEIDLQMYNI